MVASLKGGISMQGVTIGKAPNPVFFDDQFDGTSQNLDVHLPNIYPVGMQWNIDGSPNTAGLVNGGYVTWSGAGVGNYGFNSFGDSSNNPMTSATEYRVDFRWYSGTQSLNPPTYYATYLISRHIAGNLGFLLEANATDIVLTPIGGTPTNITISDNTYYTGSYVVTDTTVTVTIDTVFTQTFANPIAAASVANRRPYGWYILFSGTTRFDYITAQV